MKKKYILMPGYVYSKHDHDKHYIGAGKLAQLYGVSLAECIIVHENTPASSGCDFGFFNLPVLRPRYNGDYKLPKGK